MRLCMVACALSLTATPGKQRDIRGASKAYLLAGGLASSSSACKRSRLEAYCRRGLSLKSLSIAIASGKTTSEPSTLATSSSTAFEAISERKDDAADAVKMLALHAVLHLGCPAAEVDLAVDRGRSADPSALPARAAEGSDRVWCSPC